MLMLTGFMKVLRSLDVWLQISEYSMNLGGGFSQTSMVLLRILMFVCGCYLIVDNQMGCLWLIALHVEDLHRM